MIRDCRKGRNVEASQPFYCRLSGIGRLGCLLLPACIFQEGGENPLRPLWMRAELPFPQRQVLACFAGKQKPSERLLCMDVTNMKFGFLWCLSGKNNNNNNLPDYAGDSVSIPGLGRSPEEGNGNAIQYSCLGKPMDREAWWATVHGIAKE